MVYYRDMKLKNTTDTSVASLLLRLGLAFVFLYAGISAFRQPEAWISFIPSFTTKFVAAKTSLDLISAMQIVLAVWLLSGVYIRYAALLATAFVVGLIAFNLNTLLITFRDVAIAAASLALFFMPPSPKAKK